MTGAGREPASIEHIDAEQWQRWRALRLRALADAPEAFGSTLAGTLERDRREGEAFWRAYFSMPGPVFVARRGSQDVGMVRMLLPTDEGEPAELISLWVAPSERGLGTGRALLAAAADALHAVDPTLRCHLAVKIDNAPARSLYARCGFHRIGTNPEDPTEDLMERAPGPRENGRATSRGAR